MFTVTTDRIRLRWRAAQARAVHPEGGTPGVAVRVLDGSDEARMDVDPAATALAEETAYAVTVEALGDVAGDALSVRHDDPVVEAAFEALAPGVVHGLVHTGAHVGMSRFVVVVGGVEHVAVTVEVCPSKLDYRTDFRLLVDDLGRMADDLALAVVSAAYVEAHPVSGLDDGEREASGGGPLTRATLLGTFVGTLERSLAYAFQQPLRHAVPAPAAVALHRLRRVPPAAAGRLARASDGSSSDFAAPRLVQPALAWSADTPEHRYLAHHLRAAAHDARLLARGLPPSLRGRAGAERLGALAGRLERLSVLGPLGEVPSDAPPPAAAPLRLGQAPGYREAAHVLRLVRQRLSLGEGGPVRARLRALHRLYEAWTWLAVVEALGAATGHRVPPHRLVRTDASGTRLRLRVGPSRLVFPAPGGGRLVLRHAPRFDAAPALVAQQPDLLLEQYPRGDRTAPPARAFVLDAKYRLDRSDAFVARMGMPGPPAAVLGDLHRYRDALLAPGGQRFVTHAAALYPHRASWPAWQASALARALGEIGVGAVPVLPGSTDVLRRVLAAWIGGG